MEFIKEYKIKIRFWMRKVEGRKLLKHILFAI